MDQTKAFEIIGRIQNEMGEGLLETMIYMDRHLFQFDPEQRQAFHVLFTFEQFRQMFATTEAE